MSVPDKTLDSIKLFKIWLASLEQRLPRLNKIKNYLNPTCQQTRVKRSQRKSKSSQCQVKVKVKNKVKVRSRSKSISRFRSKSRSVLSNDHGFRNFSSTWQLNKPVRKIESRVTSLDFFFKLKSQNIIVFTHIGLWESINQHNNTGA